jgi:hypothetical protein
MNRVPDVSPTGVKSLVRSWVTVVRVSILRGALAGAGVTGAAACVPADPPAGGDDAGSGGAFSASGGSGVGGTGGLATGTGGQPGSGGVVGTGGIAASGGAPGTGGRGAGGGGTGGAAASGGAPGTGGRGTGGRGTGGGTGTGGGIGTGGAGGTMPRFSFFVTSIEAMRALSGSENGFGGDLKFGEATGLAGADKICREVAKRGMPGAEAKTWRAFLSATTGGEGGGPVNAIDRVGPGPWYDRMGRMVASSRANLMMTRPAGGEAGLGSDLPNENGIPNRQGVDNHDTLTGSTSAGMLMSTTAASTCNDWTSAVGSTGRPMLGHSWPASSGQSWIQAHAAAGCAPSVNINGTGGPPPGSDGVGSGGGYGGIYCFALTP